MHKGASPFGLDDGLDELSAKVKLELEMCSYPKEKSTRNRRVRLLHAEIL